MPHPLAASRNLLPSTSSTTTTLPSGDSVTLTPATRRMIAVESVAERGRGALVMAGNVRPLAKVGDRNPSFSESILPDQASAVRKMRSAVPENVTAVRVRDALGWKRHRAARWVVFAKAKGYLGEDGEWLR